MQAFSGIFFNMYPVEGNVFFEQMGQAVSAERLELNLETKRGTLYKSTAYTNRTPDGTTLLVDALRADKVGENSYILEKCADDLVPGDSSHMELYGETRTYHGR